MGIRLLICTIFLTSLLAAQSGNSQSASSSIPVDQANQQKARNLINQGIQALGGSAYLNISDISQEGRTYSFYHGKPNSLGVLFWRFYKYPDKDRVELTKQRDVAYLNVGDKGYEITYRGVHPEDPKDLATYLRRRHYALDVVLRTWISDPKTALFYEGSTVSDEKPAERVTILNAKNEGLTVDFDQSTHLPLHQSYSWRDPTDKQRNVEEVGYDGYREVQGIMTPFRITMYYNGDMAGQRFLTSVTYNKGLADSLFEPTAIKAK
ncbi:MAG TPA: hypothetical protein VMH85_03110 [Terriglobales bacterium]|nr:hypothetical protein [Terriglobales bacterium]